MGPDPAAGRPPDRGGGGDLRAVLPRAPARPRRGPRPGCPAEQPDGRFAVEAGHGHDLVQEPVFLGSGGLLVARALHGGILAQAGSGHGALLREIGNRDF